MFEAAMTKLLVIYILIVSLPFIMTFLLFLVRLLTRRAVDKHHRKVRYEAKKKEFQRKKLEREQKRLQLIPGEK